MANPLGIGGIKKGEVRNPRGRQSPYQDMIVRMRHLVEKYGADEILQIVSDPKRFGKLSVFDAMIMRRLSEAMDKEGRQSMDSLLDRILGKPTQYIQSKNEDTVTLNVEERAKAANKEAEDLLQKARGKNK